MEKRHLGLLTFILAAIFLISSVLTAQVRTAGSISGYITDDAKEPLPGVSVTASSPTLLGTRHSMTDAKGYYRLQPLPPGRYTIVVELDQFKKETQENIEVNVAAMLRLDFVLVPKTVEGKEIVVTAAAPLIQTEKTTMDTVITNTILNSLPILGRDFMQSIKILPGVTDSSYGVSISGSRDVDKNYNIDGSDNVDIIQGEIFGGASYQLYLNKPFMPFDQEAIQELSVGRGAYSADVGFGSGGLINVLTKSGSNAYHGSLYFNARNDKWDYKAPYAYQDYIFGGSLGGPIIKDKLLFFMTLMGNYNKTGYDPRTIYQQNIPPDIRDTTKGVSTFLKLTYLLDPKNTFNLTANLIPWNNYDYYVTLWRTGHFPLMTDKNKDVAITINETANLNSNLLVESILSVGQTVKKTINQPGEHQGFIYIFEPDGSLVGGGTYSSDMNYRRSKINWSEKATVFVDDWMGRHAINAGLELRYNASSQRKALEDTESLIVGVVDEHDITAAFDQKFHQTYTAAYVADSWQPLKKLTVKPGFRLSNNSYRSRLLFEPRFDFAYDPFGDGKTIVRGGANLYYERMNAYIQQLEEYPLMDFLFVYPDGSTEQSARPIGTSLLIRI